MEPQKITCCRIESDKDHWSRVTENLFSEFVSEHLNQPDGRNVIFRVRDGRKLAAHEEFLSRTTNFFHRITRQKDPFGNVTIVLPDVDFMALKNALQIIYNGAVFLSEKQELSDVNWVLINVFGLTVSDFKLDVGDDFLTGEDLGFLDEPSEDCITKSSPKWDNDEEDIFINESGVLDDDQEDAFEDSEVDSTNDESESNSCKSNEVVGSLKFGMTFDSWDECQKTIKRVCLEENLKVICTKANKRREKFPEEFPYYTACFQCAKPRSNKRLESCPFKISVRFLARKKKMFISKIINVHEGHKPSTLEKKGLKNVDVKELNSVSYEGRLEEGGTFKTYKEFLKIFQKYCYDNCIYFRTRKSNVIREESGEKIPNRIEFVCKYFIEPHRIKDSESCCPFSLKLYKSLRTGLYKIRSLVVDHEGHELKPEYFNDYNTMMKPFKLTEFMLPNPRTKDQSQNEADDFDQVSYEGRLQQGETFDTYKEFLKIFQKYCYEKCIYYQTYRSSLGVNEKGEKVIMRTGLFCKYSGDPASAARGKGIRTCTISKSFCPFYVKISYLKRIKKYQIGDICLDHEGHELKPEYYVKDGNIQKPFALSEFPFRNALQEASPHREQSLAALADRMKKVPAS